MRKILTLALVLTMCSGAALADSIGAFSDAAGTSCAINPTAFGVVTVYFIHNTAGAVVSKFKVNDLLGLGAPIGTTITAGFPSIGTFTAGIEIGYTACKNSPVLLGNMAYFYQLQPMSCANSMTIVAHPLSEIPGEPLYVDCQQPFGDIHPSIGGYLWGGADAAACGGCLPTVPTAESTWGGIKALYR